MDSIDSHIAIIILAAGSSSRLGKPKQLLQYKNQSLLRRATDIALSVSEKVLVITGSSAAEMTKELDGSGAQIIQNPNWKEGIASSIRAGIDAVKRLDSIVDGVILMVADQPFVTDELLRNIIETNHTTAKPIVASAYGGTLGIPVYFDKSYFSQLLGLTGDNGAKKLILQYAQIVARVDFPQGDIDIDTEKDYELLTGKT